VPLLLTQGLTENNTVADGMQQYLDNHTGYERAWLGPWEHVRGNERCGEDDGSTGCSASNVGRLKMGRAGWFDEAMRFYDRFLKGVNPTVADPPIAVQTNDGKWRSEAQWPPTDKSLYTTALRAGSYDDTAQSYSTGSEDDPTSNSGVWTVSKPLPYDVHLAGSGSASVNVTTERSQREPGDRRLRPRRQRRGAAHHAPGPPGPSDGRLDDPAGAVGRRLEARRRAPHRRARDR
jgi:putative CocE/NonD family hydrolase